MDKWEFVNTKKTKSIFTDVKDEAIKKELIELTGCPKDAKEFFFWRNEGDMRWGLTMKPKLAFGESPPVWCKLSLTGKIGGNILRPSKDSTSMLMFAENDIFNRILEIYKKIII